MYKRFAVVVCVVFVLTCVLPLYLTLAETECEHDDPIYPDASERNVLQKGQVTVDISNAWQGYIMVRLEISPGEFIVILARGDKKHQHHLKGDGEYTTLPLSKGNGEYVINVYELTEPGTNIYREVFHNKFDVFMPDPLSVFLIPNGYVWFTRESALVAKAEELCAKAADDYELIDILFNYVSENIMYDYIKAVTVARHYRPDADEILEIGRGICFDYAALFAGMLRAHGIPTKLVIGNHMASNPPRPHAWTEVYMDGNWRLMDPTFKVDIHLDPNYVAQKVC